MGRPSRTSAARITERGQAFRAPDVSNIAEVAPPEPAAPPVVALPSRTAAITIERLILHHLDNRTGEMLLVEAELALDATIHALFASYIAQALENADWQARFLADQPAAPAMPDLCARLLGEPSAFVAVSQEMARRLFAQMRQRPNQINPGDFVVAIYTAPGLPALGIALFKLDPDARLVRNFSTERGRRLVRIALADNLMPETVRQKQKCALITPAIDGAGFSLALLDTQANIRSEGVAAYFYRGFLATQILPSARRRTRLFLRATDDWLADRGASLTPHALLHVYAARREALAGETLDLPAFALAALPDNGALAADLLASVTPQVFDAAFEPRQTHFTVDRATADPIVRTVTLELDGGARLIVPAERFAAMALVDVQRVGGKIRLTIETLTLKEGTGR
ncbi:MAG TPA: nucleoid-associated protein [Ktedonobacterales bacterium]|nr:nucleoid-associated protein [Ktedonobacterales bacterium]